jgi:sulfite exporter TauE/SafE
MIAWSNTKLKFTSGIGALCVTGMLADLSQQKLSFWLVLIVAMVPLLVFLFIQPEEMRRSIVLPFQVFASVWYLLSAIILSVLFLVRGELPRGFPVYFIGLAIGCIPCVMVFRRLLDPPHDRP